MAKFILRNRKTDELIPVNLTPEQERLLVFLENHSLDLFGFNVTTIGDEFQEV